MIVSLLLLYAALFLPSCHGFSSKAGARGRARLWRQLSLSSASPTDSSSSSSSVSSKTCKNCKKQFSNGQTTSGNECRYHPGYYTGRLNRINDVDTSDLEFFWSCCGEYSSAAEGCLVRSMHFSYDEEDPEKYSPYGLRRS